MTDRKSTDAELQNRLTPEQYRVTQQCGTEPPFENEYWNEKRAGMYRCIVCGAELFSSKTKYDSHSGWPSFTAPAETKAVAEKVDDSHGLRRTEVVCKKCSAHLGHVFPDGPTEAGGLRYCINSAALKLTPHE